ncbi:hypothetical protein NPX13_g454 [Xylaria arbuscula]|uniref:Uncharacterized protein n=1 Tax=Xylaria arbuscula TaxID=114810 RepID=A0A9W8NNH8_9PEZI|nr:hypothetical protein NPX13_g454 [Xylaria arbuscula]
MAPSTPKLECLSTIEHYNSYDTLAPNNISTGLLATIYYPTLQKPYCEPQPYIDPELAAILQPQLNHTLVFLSTITSTLHYNAPFLEGEAGRSGFPTLLFGPGGGGPPVEGNTILISELVSQGTGVGGVEIDFDDAEILQAIYDTRLVDIGVILNYFPELVQRLGAPFNTTHIGSFRYSLGGAAAVSAIYNDDRLLPGLNPDGALVGRPTFNDIRANAKKPVLFFGEELHTGKDDMHDITLGTFPLWQTEYFGKILVNGTLHHDFCDYTFWETIEPTYLTTGPIDGNRQIEIMYAYVKGFLDFTLMGEKSPILSGPSPEGPVVIFYE